MTDFLPFPHRELTPQGWQDKLGLSAEDWSLTELSRFKFSVRLECCLRRCRMATVAEVRAISDQQWLGVPNFGRKTLTELRDALGPYQAPGGSVVEAPPRPDEVPRHCENCAHYAADDGVCRRYAPQPRFTAALNHDFQLLEKSELGPAAYNLTWWPEVSPTDWCGEFVVARHILTRKA